MQLRDALAERIASGEWKPGSAIPNEGDLAREFGVSAGTMRKALSLLENEHLITRRQGRGTYVNDPAAEGLADRFCNIRGAEGKPIVGRFEASEVAGRLPPPRKRSDCRYAAARSGVAHPARPLRGDNAFMYEEVSLPGRRFSRPERKLEPHRPSWRIIRPAARQGGRADSVGVASRRRRPHCAFRRVRRCMVLDRVVFTIEADRSNGASDNAAPPPAIWRRCIDFHPSSRPELLLRAGISLPNELPDNLGAPRPPG